MVGEVFQPIVEITCLFNASTIAMGKKKHFSKVIAWVKIFDTMSGFQCVFTVQTFCYYIDHIESISYLTKFGPSLAFWKRAKEPYLNSYGELAVQ